MVRAPEDRLPSSVSAHYFSDLGRQIPKLLRVGLLPRINCGRYWRHSGHVAKPCCRSERRDAASRKDLSKKHNSLQGAPGAQIDHFEKLRRGLTLTLRISYGGTRAWRVGYYAKINGKMKPQAKTLGRYPELGVAARKAAFEFDPKAANAAAQAGSFKAVAEDWVKRYVVKKGLRSKDEIERILGKYIYPAWAGRPFFEIRRGDVNDLLDKLEDEHGAPQTDRVLAALRSIMNWFATRERTIRRQS